MRRMNLIVVEGALEATVALKLLGALWIATEGVAPIDKGGRFLERRATLQSGGGPPRTQIRARGYGRRTVRECVISPAFKTCETSELHLATRETHVGELAYGRRRITPSSFESAGALDSARSRQYRASYKGPCTDCAQVCIPVDSPGRSTEDGKLGDRRASLHAADGGVCQSSMAAAHSNVTIANPSASHRQAQRSVCCANMI